MPQAVLNIPVIVQQVEVDDALSYHIRPVFTHFPVATHRRYEQALQLFKKGVRQQFKGYVLDRNDLDHLLWFTCADLP